MIGVKVPLSEFLGTGDLEGMTGRRGGGLLGTRYRDRGPPQGSNDEESLGEDFAQKIKLKFHKKRYNLETRQGLSGKGSGNDNRQGESFCDWFVRRNLLEKASESVITVDFEGARECSKSMLQKWALNAAICSGNRSLSDYQEDERVFSVRRFTTREKVDRDVRDNGRVYELDLKFSVDKRIILKGVNLFQIRGYSTTKFCVELNLFEKDSPTPLGERCLIAREIIGGFKENQSINFLHGGILLQPGNPYKLSVSMGVFGHRPFSLKTSKGTGPIRAPTVVTCNDDKMTNSVTFSFLGENLPKKDIPAGPFTSGQVPELIFSLAH